MIIITIATTIIENDILNLRDTAAEVLCKIALIVTGWTSKMVEMKISNKCILFLVGFLSMYILIYSGVMLGVHTQDAERKFALLPMFRQRPRIEILK